MTTAIRAAGTLSQAEVVASARRRYEAVVNRYGAGLRAVRAVLARWGKVLRHQTPEEDVLALARTVGVTR